MVVTLPVRDRGRVSRSQRSGGWSVPGMARGCVWYAATCRRGGDGRRYEMESVVVSEANGRAGLTDQETGRGATFQGPSPPPSSSLEHAIAPTPRPCIRPPLPLSARFFTQLELPTP